MSAREFSTFQPSSHHGLTRASRFLVTILHFQSEGFPRSGRVLSCTTRLRRQVGQEKPEVTRKKTGEHTLQPCSPSLGDTDPRHRVTRTLAIGLGLLKRPGRLRLIRLGLKSRGCGLPAAKDGCSQDQWERPSNRGLLRISLNGASQRKRTVDKIVWRYCTRRCA